MQDDGREPGISDDGRVEALTHAEVEAFLEAGDRQLEQFRADLAAALPDAERASVLAIFDELVRLNPGMTALGQTLRAYGWEIIDGSMRSAFVRAAAELGPPWFPSV